VVPGGNVASGRAMKLGRIDLDGAIPIVAAGFGSVDPSVLKDALAIGLDVAELRIDLYKDTGERAVLEEVAKFRGVPSIATIRMTSEGGQWTGSESARLSLFSAVVKSVDAVDVELRADIRADVARLAHDAGRLAVMSFHEFQHTPPLDALVSRVDEAVQAGADIVKIATFADNDRDVQTLARLLSMKHQSKLIVIAMGSHGTKSRVFFPALGSLITFASVGRSTAPGQLELDEMVDEMRAFYPKYNERKISQLGLMAV
jgi:3-dehydroquinate dehydratase-1